MTYQVAGVPIPRTIWLLAEDIFKTETEKFLEQHATKEGPLYSKWLQARAAKIREDIEERKAFKPEKVTV